MYRQYEDKLWYTVKVVAATLIVGIFLGWAGTYVYYYFKYLAWEPGKADARVHIALVFDDALTKSLPFLITGAAFLVIFMAALWWWNNNKRKDIIDEAKAEAEVLRQRSMLEVSDTKMQADFKAAETISNAKSDASRFNADREYLEEKHKGELDKLEEKLQDKERIIGQLYERLKETVSRPKEAAIRKFREEGNEKAAKRLEKQLERQLAELEKLLS